MALVRRAWPLLGTFVEATIAGLDGARARSALAAAFDEVAAVHRLMSFHAGGSDLDRLHRAPPGRRVAVDRRTIEVLGCALRVASASRGRFDPTVAAREVARGRLPRPASPWTPDADADWRDIELDEGHVRLARPLWIDLGGIAKGYAVDRAVEVLIDAGAERVCVNAGGDLRVAGTGAQTVHLRTPAGIAAGLELLDAAVATSTFETPTTASGRLRAQPQSGSAWRTVSVVAGRCMTADALTKVVLAGDARLARHVLKRFDAQALVQRPRRRPVALGAAA